MLYWCLFCCYIAVYFIVYSEVASSAVPAGGRGSDLVSSVRSPHPAKPARILGSWEVQCRNKPERHKSDGTCHHRTAGGGDCRSAIPSGQLLVSKKPWKSPSRNNQSHRTWESVHWKICGDRNGLKQAGHITAPNARDYFFLSAAILIVDYYFGNFIISSLGCSLLFINFFWETCLSLTFFFLIFFISFSLLLLYVFFFYFLIEGPGTHLYHCKYVTIFSSMYARVCVRREINPALVILGHVSSLLSYLCRDTW